MHAVPESRTEGYISDGFKVAIEKSIPSLQEDSNQITLSLYYFLFYKITVNLKRVLFQKYYVI